jgi:C4-dicarboxylate-binding protein DctP
MSWERVMTSIWRYCFPLACLALAPFTAGADQIKLRATTQLPLASPLGANLMQLKREVEEKSGGAISIEIYDSNSPRMIKDDEVLGAVSSGAIEIGVLPVPQFHKAVRAMEVIEHPFFFNFEALVRAAADPDGELRKLLDTAILESTGTRVLLWQAFGSSVFFAKGQDAKTPASIQGKKVRVAGENMAEVIKYCGGIPFVMLASKQKKAIDDGEIDLTISGITTVKSRELWKSTDTITRTEHAMFEFVVIVNEKAWRSLSRDHRSIVVAAARRAERDLRRKSADIDAEAYAFARSKGMKVIELTPDDVAEWRACSAAIVVDFMQAAGDLGERVMSIYAKLRMDPCCSAGPTGEFTKH